MISIGKLVNSLTIDMLTKKKNDLEKVINTLILYINQENQTLHDELFRKYLEVQRVDDVANYLNDKGYRIKSTGKSGKRKYISNDVSNIINSLCKDIDADDNLHIFTKTVFNYNKGKAKWGALLKLIK